MSRKELMSRVCAEQIIGVVRDFSMDAIHKRIAPTVFGVAPAYFQFFHLKLI